MEESKDIIKAKLDSLNDSSIWTFAKQDTNFENIFKAVCIFNGSVRKPPPSKFI